MRSTARTVLLPLLLLTSCLPGAQAQVTATPPAATAIPTATPDVTVYTVRPGDSLSVIAEENRTTIDVLTRENDISDPDRIEAGQKLVIPIATATPPPASQGERGRDS